MTWTLKAISGTFDGEEVRVDQDKLLGRDPNSVDVVLQGGRISRRHAKLFLRDDQLWVKDLNSANGTFVNGGRVEGEQQLHIDDVLQLDVIHFVVASDSAVVDIAAPAPAPAPTAAPVIPSPAPSPVAAPLVESTPDTKVDADAEGTPVRLIAAIIVAIILAILAVVYATN